MKAHARDNNQETKNTIIANHLGKKVESFEPKRFGYAQGSMEAFLFGVEASCLNPHSASHQPWPFLWKVFGQLIVYIGRTCKTVRCRVLIEFKLKGHSQI